MSSDFWRSPTEAVSSEIEADVRGSKYVCTLFKREGGEASVTVF